MIITDLIEKPPIGLKPLFVVLENRIDEINEAMDRYSRAGESIPFEWLMERCKITSWLNKISNQ